MTEDQARVFCESWLGSWTGNQPEALIGFYARDAYYQDPVVPDGLAGHDAILPYLRKLLAANPDWTWRAEEIIPTERGFMLKWAASIPTAPGIIEAVGLDIVEVEDGRITRNEVYFDRTPLLKALGRM